MVSIRFANKSKQDKDMIFIRILILGTIYGSYLKNIIIFYSCVSMDLQ